MAKPAVRKTGRIIVRLYALAIMLIALWTGYAAIAFLVRAVFGPVRLPPGFLEGVGRLDAAALRTEHVPGVTGPAARAPYAHYHLVDRWFPLDPHNGCTPSGCHSPLPHTRSKEVRAFANFHATFMTCEMCHDRSVKGPTRAVWVNIATGREQEPPASLRLIRLLASEADRIRNAPADVHPTLAQLLRETVESSAGDPLLSFLLVEMTTSEPGSPAWRHAMEQLSAALPHHARGDYGAKLAPDVTRAPASGRAQAMAEAAARFRAAAPGSPERDTAYQAIHAPVLARPDACLTCHGDEPPRLDLEALGYTAERAAAMRGEPIARLVQQLREGRPFYLPRATEASR